MAIPVSTDLPGIGDEAARSFSDPFQVKGLDMQSGTGSECLLKCPVMLIKVVTEDNIQLVQQVDRYKCIG